MAVLMNAKEISEELGISKTLAYQIMEKLNKELEAKGFFVIKTGLEDFQPVKVLLCLHDLKSFF